MTKKHLQAFTIMLAILSCLPSCTKVNVQAASEKTVESFDYIRLTEVINELIQLDIDTFHTYSQAIKVVKNKNFRNQLMAFRDDHEGHIQSLSKAVIDLGGYPPSFSRDFRGLVTSGYTIIKSATSTIGALEAMETNEIISNRYYDKAYSIPMPFEVKALIFANMGDERRHLEAIRKMIGEIKGRK